MEQNSESCLEGSSSATAEKPVKENDTAPQTSDSDSSDDTIIVKINQTEPSESPMYLLSNNGVLCWTFFEDQRTERKNFTDLDLICCDGYIQVHRCLLMGASEFLRDLLMEKNILDTSAITLPDVSTRHLEQVLRLLYAGKTVIDKCDEVEVFKTMSMLGFPASELLCRSAKDNDLDQTVELRHIPSSHNDDSGVVLDEMQESLGKKAVSNEDSDHDTGIDEGETFSAANEKKEELAAADAAGGFLEPQNDNEPKPATIKDDDEDDDGDEGDMNLQQITSTTGDSESLNDYPPSANESNLNNESGSFIQAIEENIEGDLKLNENLDALLRQKNSHDAEMLKSDDEGSGKDVIINEDSDRNSDVESIDDDDLQSQSQSNNATNSVISASDLEDLNFEEACNDLQKQVAKPMSVDNTKTPTTTDNTNADTPVTSASSSPMANGHDMKLRKRKLSGNGNDEDKSIGMKTRSGRFSSDNIKNTKDTSPKKAKKSAITNGTKSGEEDEIALEKLEGDNVAVKSVDTSPDRESISSTKSGSSDSPSQQRALSACSSTTTDSAVSKIFIKTVQLYGELYNEYALVDLNNKSQPGKRIAIPVRNDKTINPLVKN